MENGNDPTRRRRMLPPRYPSPAMNLSSLLHRPSRPPFQYNAAATHFASRSSIRGSGWTTGCSSYQTLLSNTTSGGGVGAGGVGGSSGACYAQARPFSQGTTFPGSSCYQMPSPSSLALAPISAGGGGVGGGGSSSSRRHGLVFSQPSFLSSLDAGLAAVVAPTRTPQLSSFADQAAAAASSSSSSLPPLPSQSTTLFGSTEYYLPPLSPTLPPLGTPMNLLNPHAAPVYISLVDHDAAVDDSESDHDIVSQYVDLDGLWGLNSSDDSTEAVPDHHAGGGPLASSSSPAEGSGQNGAVSWVTSSLPGTNTIGSSSTYKCNFTWMPKPCFGSMPRLPLSYPSPGGAVSSSSSISSRNESRSMDEDIRALLVAEFADGTFTEDQMKKIMADERLAELVLTEPKRVRRILQTRGDSIRCRERKIMYLTDLERKVEVLHKDTNSLSARVQVLQSKAQELTTENNELRIRLHGLGQQLQQKNVLNETLSAEVHRLKLDAGEINGSHMSNSLNQQTSLQMIQPEHLEIENQLSLPQQAQEQGDLDNFITYQIVGGNCI